MESWWSLYGWMSLAAGWPIYKHFNPTLVLLCYFFPFAFLSYLLLSHWQTTVVVPCPLCLLPPLYLSLSCLSHSLCLFIIIILSCSGKRRRKWKIYILSEHIDPSSPSKKWWSYDCKNYYRAWNCVRSISAIYDRTNLKHILVSNFICSSHIFIIKYSSAGLADIAFTCWGPGGLKWFLQVFHCYGTWASLCKYVQSL